MAARERILMDNVFLAAVYVDPKCKIVLNKDPLLKQNQLKSRVTLRFQPKISDTDPERISQLKKVNLRAKQHSMCVWRRQPPAPPVKTTR